MSYQTRAGFWREAFALHGSVTLKVMPSVLIVGLAAGGICGVSWLVEELFRVQIALAVAPFEFAGAALGLLLILRTNAGYDRWWEARKLWGQLINDSRNICLKVKSFVKVDADEHRRFGRLVVGFAVALKNHLRGGKPLQAVPGFGKETAAPEHVPLQLAEWVFAQLRAWRTGGKLTDLDALMIDQHAKALMDVSGACERIRSSPVPLSYRALLRHGTIFYLLSAPWFMSGEYGYMAVGVVAMLAYFLLGIELTAEDVEEPFGKDGDDLELTRFCETIRKSIEQILGDLELGDAALSTVNVPKLT